jgi:RNA polymerase sigma factor (sigma-70 family)
MLQVHQVSLARVDPQRLFLEHLSTIDRIVQAVARRHRLPLDERDDFRSHVRLRLIEDDYRVLRAFGNRSSLSTYLTVVITRLFLDYQSHRLGRWRPSAVAARLGPEAVLLDRLITRDGHSVDEAIQVVLDRPAVGLGRRELRALWERLPPRRSGRHRPEEADADLPPAAAETVDEMDEQEQAQRIADELLKLFEGLPAADRLLVLLHFSHGVPLASLAQRFGRSKASVQRRMARVLSDWRGQLTAAGFDADAIRVAASTGNAALEGLLDAVGESVAGHGRLHNEDEF